jgi:hypothetical protein
LLLYSPNESIPILYEADAAHKSLAETLKDFEIRETQLGKGQDFLKGISYWLVSGDHLFVLQHVAIQVHAKCPSSEHLAQCAA